ncbi:hypothetical protein EXN66_Car014027 [Channa argus]|uniref:Uncharacterized protein n=1 Tax=Channa argus TaxID=215402 RepID=A0A6G1Q860_CHAAH|nr:hypothetical protein EXN66_Car014027 [Channa argus]
MKSSSVTATQETQLLQSSSSPPRRPQLSLQSPELQAEFLQERQNKLRPCSNSDSGLVSPFSLTSSTSPPLPPPTSDTPLSSPCSSSSSSSPSPCSDNSSARLSLSSPELLSELKQSRTRSLRHVRTHSGLTTIFSGRGRRGGEQDTAANPSTQLPTQKTLH